jgi:uncharacterized membrane protein
MKRSRVADSLTVAGLVLLGIVPAIAGSMRLRQLASGIATAEDARFLAMPGPIAVHVVGAVLFALPGAFQFSAELRRRKMAWHRLSGAILVPCGFAVSLTGLWMAQFYPSVGLDGAAVYWMRIVVGLAMTAALWLGLSAVHRHDIPAHRAWMMRAYALGMGAGTQVLTHLPLMIVPSLKNPLSRAIAMGGAWAINAVVAELLIRRSAHPGSARLAGSGAPVVVEDHERGAISGGGSLVPARSTGASR